MSRANTIQTNFTAGEVSPRMRGRIDVNKYFNGARKLRNMIVAPQGGAYRRPGTRYRAETKDSTKRSVLLKFRFSDNQPYVLEFGHQYVRFFYDNAPVAVLGTPIEVVTPYDEAHVAQLKITQSADVLYITHPSYYPRTLSRTSHTSWAMALYANVDGPYLSTPQEEKTSAVVLQDVAIATAVGGTPFSAATLKTITNVTAGAANVVQITATGHGYSTGNSIAVAQVLGAVEANGLWVVTVIDANNFSLNGSQKIAANTYVSGGTASVFNPATVPTRVPYHENNVWKLARVLQAYSTTAALVDVIDTVLDYDSTILVTVSGAYCVSSTSLFSNADLGKTVRASDGTWFVITGFTNSTTVTGGAATNIVSYTYPTVQIRVTGRRISGVVTSDTAVFVSTDVGRLIRLEFLAEWVPGTIVAYVSSTVVHVVLDRTIPLDPSGPVGTPYNYTGALKFSCDGRPTNWLLGAWSVATGYPAVVTFHQQRIVFASTTEEPLTVWFGESGDYVGFSPNDPQNSEVSDANAITITLVSSEVNPVRWMSSGPVLLVGTEGAEWQIKPSSITQTLTPTNISATGQTFYGSIATDQAHRVGTQTLHIQRSGKKLREMSYDFSIDAFVSKDLSIISEHIPRLHGGILVADLQHTPFNVVWLVLGDGLLAGITYEREHEVVGWHLHEIGGSGLVESVCCVESQVKDADDVYLIVKRTINGSVRRYIETIDHLPNPSSDADLGSSFYVDCGLSLDNVTPTDTTTVTGLSHLNTLSAQLVVDGVFVGTATVSAGAVTVKYRATKIHVGLAQEAIVGILEPEGGSQAGTSQGKRKRINEVTVRVENSYFFKVATATTITDARMVISGTVDPIATDRKRIVPGPIVNTQLTSAPYNAPTSEVLTLMSGDMNFAIDDSFDNGGEFELVQDEPYPMNILALMPALNTNE